MRWLLHPATRAHRLAILQLRWRTLTHGDDPIPALLPVLYALFAITLAVPGSTTDKTPAWEWWHANLGGDTSLGIGFGVLALVTTLAAFDLVGVRLQAAAWLASTAALVGLTFAVVWSYPLSLWPAVLLVLARASMWAYVRADRE